MAATETPQSGTKDKNYDLITVTHLCLEHVWRLDQYAQDAEREGDQELVDTVPPDAGAQQARRRGVQAPAQAAPGRGLGRTRRSAADRRLPPKRSRRRGHDRAREAERQVAERVRVGGLELVGVADEGDVLGELPGTAVTAPKPTASAKVFQPPSGNHSSSSPNAPRARP
jgi:hypothetical protein